VSVSLESVFEIIKDELDKGKAVKISGFGKWTVKSKKKRNGRNPQTGEALTIDARKVITFKPSNVLKNAVNSED
jgi:integration host factor subunit alpha